MRTATNFLARFNYSMCLSVVVLVFCAISLILFVGWMLSSKPHLTRKWDRAIRFNNNIIKNIWRSYP